MGIALAFFMNSCSIHMFMRSSNSLFHFLLFPLSLHPFFHQPQHHFISQSIFLRFLIFSLLTTKNVLSNSKVGRKDFLRGSLVTPVCLPKTILSDGELRLLQGTITFGHVFVVPRRSSRATGQGLLGGTRSMQPRRQARPFLKGGRLPGHATES